jgi:general L-amino acid transport system substrate-binding protein
MYLWPLPRPLLFSLLIGIITLAASSNAEAASTLGQVRARGHLICGVSEAAPGFSTADDNGHWSGMDVDFCAAIAAAVLGDRKAVKYRALAAADRFRSLASGDIDVLSGAASLTLTRDTELGIRFVGVLFYDGQGFLVRRAHALTSVFELSGASICALAGTTADKGLTDFFRARQMRFQLVSTARWEDLVKAYASDSCTLLSGDLSALAQERGRLANPPDHIILPEVVLKEPLGPAVRQGDEQWHSIVRWTLFALILAEEFGVSSQNAEEHLSSTVLAVRQLLGLEGETGPGLGLARNWAYEAIRQVGNYGEIYDRSFGANSPMRLERAANALWTQGGLMYAPPFR